jgi:hypothetical protein
VITHPAKVEGLFFCSIFDIFCVEPGTSYTSTPSGLVTLAHLKNSKKFSNALYKKHRNCAKLMQLRMKNLTITLPNGIVYSMYCILRLHGTPVASRYLPHSLDQGIKNILISHHLGDPNFKPVLIHVLSREYGVYAK